MLSVVMDGMLAPRNHLKIGYAIIFFIAIYMVYNFIKTKASIEVPFHDKPVLSDIGFFPPPSFGGGYPHKYISEVINFSSTIPPAIELSRGNAFKRTEPHSLSETAIKMRDCFSAIKTCWSGDKFRHAFTIDRDMYNVKYF